MDANEIVEIKFNRLNLEQLLYVRAVMLPELQDLLAKHSDALFELADVGGCNE